MMKKNNYRKLILSVVVVAMLCQLLMQPFVSHASDMNVKSRGVDIVTRERENRFSIRKTMVSISPSGAAQGIPADVKTISCKAVLKGYMHYDRITGAYVSASSPTVYIEYQGRVALTLDSVSTSYRDNGSSVTFYYSANLMGRITSDLGMPCVINYGNISGNFTVSK